MLATVALFVTYNLIFEDGGLFNDHSMNLG